jgi:hypothetical protein
MGIWSSDTRRTHLQLFAHLRRTPVIMKFVIIIALAASAQAHSIFQASSLIQTHRNEFNIGRVQQQNADL